MIVYSSPVLAKLQGRQEQHLQLKVLDPEIVPILDRWVDAGQDLAEFFAINDLGKPASYDLRRWIGSEGKQPVPAYVRDNLDAGRLLATDLAFKGGRELLGGDPAEFELGPWQ